jgi:flagellar biosynthetic protein FliO
LINKLKTCQFNRIWVNILGGLGLVLLVVLGIVISNPKPPTTSGPVQPNIDLSYPGLLVSIILKLGVVVLLIYITLLLLKRWQAGKVGIAPRRLSILESNHISPRQSIHLVKVDQRLFFIGATDQSITCLGEIEPQNEPAQLTIQPNSQPLFSNPGEVNFASILIKRLLHVKAN